MAACHIKGRSKSIRRAAGQTRAQGHIEVEHESGDYCKKLLDLDSTLDMAEMKRGVGYLLETSLLLGLDARHHGVGGDLDFPLPS